MYNFHTLVEPHPGHVSDVICFQGQTPAKAVDTWNVVVTGQQRQIVVVEGDFGGKTQDEHNENGQVNYR